MVRVRSEKKERIEPPTPRSAVLEVKVESEIETMEDCKSRAGIYQSKTEYDKESAGKDSMEVVDKQSRRRQRRTRTVNGRRNGNIRRKKKRRC